MAFLRLSRATEDEQPDGPMVFVASTPGTKRDGLDLTGLPWSVENYRANPVVTWVHDFAGNRLPIGRAEVEVVSGQRADRAQSETVRAAITFDRDDPFAAEVERKYRNGFLHAVSVSWDDVDASGVPTSRAGGKAVAHELLEIAAVPVPGDPAALIERQAVALRSLARELDAVMSGADVDDAPAGGEDVGKRMLPGSYEELRDKITTALHAQRSDVLPGARDAWVLSTLADRVLATADFGAVGEYDPRFFIIPYTRKGDDFTFGEAQRVDVEWKTEVKPHKGGRYGVRTVAVADGAEYALDGDKAGSGAVEGEADAEADEAQDAPVTALDDDAFPETPERAWAAMVRAFDRHDGASDDVRRKRYNRAEAAYRRLGMVAPEWLGGDELRALDDAAWRGLWLEGEIVAARAGAVLSRRNLARLDAAIDALMEIRREASGEDGEDIKPKAGDDTRAAIGEAIGELTVDDLQRLHAALFGGK